MLSEKTIEELRLILREDYGREINRAEASEIALGMVGYFDLLANIWHRGKIKNDNNDNNNEHRGV